MRPRNRGGVVPHLRHHPRDALGQGTPRLFGLHRRLLIGDDPLRLGRRRTQQRRLDARGLGGLCQVRWLRSRLPRRRGDRGNRSCIDRESRRDRGLGRLRTRSRRFFDRWRNPHFVAEWRLFFRRVVGLAFKLEHGANSHRGNRRHFRLGLGLRQHNRLARNLRRGVEHRLRHRHFYRSRLRLRCGRLWRLLQSWRGNWPAGIDPLLIGSLGRTFRGTPRAKTRYRGRYVSDNEDDKQNGYSGNQDRSVWHGPMASTGRGTAGA